MCKCEQELGLWFTDLWFLAGRNVGFSHSKEDTDVYFTDNVMYRVSVLSV